MTQHKAPPAAIACVGLAALTALLGTVAGYSLASTNELGLVIGISVAVGSWGTAAVLWAIGRICEDVSILADLTYKLSQSAPSPADRDSHSLSS